MKNKSKKLSLNPQSSILNSRKAFTLIEMLIVVAIIGILASAIMVGLGPAQQKGRDARRESDLRQIQNALELYYSKNGYYPYSGNGFGSDIAITLENAGIGVSSGVPGTGPDGKSYCYASDGSNYILGATLETAPPANTQTSCPNTLPGGSWLGSPACPAPNYCISF